MHVSSWLLGEVQKTYHTAILGAPARRGGRKACATRANNGLLCPIYRARSAAISRSLVARRRRRHYARPAEPATKLELLLRKQPRFLSLRVAARQSPSPVSLNQSL